jgi:hypothetical protein
MITMKNMCCTVHFEQISKNWLGLERVLKVKENGPNLSLLAQVLSKWRPVEATWNFWKGLSSYHEHKFGRKMKLFRTSVPGAIGLTGGAVFAQRSLRVNHCLQVTPDAILILSHARTRH